MVFVDVKPHISFLPYSVTERALPSLTWRMVGGEGVINGLLLFLIAGVLNQVSLNAELEEQWPDSNARLSCTAACQRSEISCC